MANIIAIAPQEKIFQHTIDFYMLTEKQLRKQIRETLIEYAQKSREVLSEQPEDSISNSEFTKALKTGAADLASSVPAALNDEMAKLIKTLSAMAQFDKSKFQKMVAYADDLGANALEKASKGEIPEEAGGAQSA